MKLQSKECFNIQLGPHPNIIWRSWALLVKRKILTNKMLPTDVNWARTSLEAEGNRRHDLKST